ncbi:MAG: transglycosylase domain-containing protein [Eubacterium sp.]|nr:transglycosylase domain-containing protein [Eubacterium sp.]
MSENNNGSIHNSAGNKNSQNGIDERIDYNISATSLTKSLFKKDREPIKTESEKKREQEALARRRANRPIIDEDLPHNRLTPRRELEAKKAASNGNTSHVSENGRVSPVRTTVHSPGNSANGSTAGARGITIHDGSVHSTSARSLEDISPREIKKLEKQEKKKAKRRGRKKLRDMNAFERIFWGFKFVIKLALLVFFSVIFACVGAGLGVYIGIIRNAPALELISIEPDSYTSFVYDDVGQQVDEFHGEENRVYVSLEEIPIDLQHAFIAIEDERFYTHNGIDFRGIARAAYSIFSGSSIQGASTITQQLIKNNVTKVTRNDVESKIQEQYLAVRYESMLAEDLGSKEAAKDYILELYLNTIYLAHGYNGVQVAAQGYYNKDAAELDLAECAVIAAITNNPSAYSPRTNPDQNKTRQSEILKKMLEQGYITDEEYEEAINEDVYSYVSSSTNTTTTASTTVHPYFIDSLFDQVSQDLQDKYSISEAQANYLIYNGGLQIYTTWDWSIQSILDDTFSDDSLFPAAIYNLKASYTVSVQDDETGKLEHSEYSKYVTNTTAAEEYVAGMKAQVESELGSTESILAERETYTIEPQSAMVIEDYHTGYVKALIGGRGEKTVNRGFNRATASTRQPGSVFKVLAAFAPGINEEVLTAATPIEDSPFTSSDGYSPSNWWGSSYRGMANPRLGIQNSMNVVAVKATSMVMDKIGVAAWYDYLMDFGFTTLEDDAHLATALGGLTNGVTQLEVTAAYATIGNEGVYKKPTLYTQVKDHNGNVLLDYDTDFEDRQVLSSGAAYVLIDMMKDVITKGTGTSAAFVNSEMPVAGKTGTTTDTKDLTFVGLTPYYAAGIWLGYDEYDSTVKNMNGLNQSAHMVVWRTCMEKIHEELNLKVKDFEMPSDVTEVYVCSYSGKLPNGSCSGHKEYFVKGTEPTEYCPGHSAARLGLDSKYTNSGYDYSYNTGYSSSNSSESSSGSSSSGSYTSGDVNLNPSDDDIQDAYDAEFGDLNYDYDYSSDDGGGYYDDGGGGSYDSYSDSGQADSSADSQEYYEDPIH